MVHIPLVLKESLIYLVLCEAAHKFVLEMYLHTFILGTPLVLYLCCLVEYAIFIILTKQVFDTDPFNLYVPKSQKQKLGW